MFEAKLNQAGVLKHVLDAIRELVTDVNFDCDEDGMKLQAMDNSHVALVALQLRASGFSQYRCDRQMTLGINVPSFQKITKCAANEDILTLRAYDDGDVLSIVSETLNTDRVAEYEMKMMDIDIEHLGIPDTRYDAEVALPSSEFNRIIRDLNQMGESIRIEATKEGVKFSATGDIGTGAVMLKHNAGANKGVQVDKDEDVIDIDSDEAKERDEDDEDSEDQVSVKRSKAKTKKGTKERAGRDLDQSQEPDEIQDVKPKVNGTKKSKKVVGDDEEDEEMGDSEDEEEEEENEEEDVDDDNDAPKSKKRKLSKNGDAGNKAKAKAKKRDGDKGKEKKEEDDLSVSISLQQSVSLTFSIKYLSNFTKATPLAKRLTLHMSNEVPLLVAYEFDTGYVRYYLAPKIEDD